MTSFISITLAFISHEHETVTAVFAASRTLMSSSIVPVTLSDNSVWDLIHARPFTKIKEDTFFSLFSSFSDTMQFTEKLCFTEKVETGVANALIRDLIDNKPYFCSTLRHIDFPHVDCIVATFSASPSAPSSDATANPTTADDNNNPSTTATTRFRNVRTIGLQHCQDLKDNHLQLIAQGFPQLEKLNLGGRSFSYEVLSEAMSKLTRLEELDMSWFDVEMSQRQHATRDLLFLKNAKKLRKLNLNFCRALKSDLFRNNFLPPSASAPVWFPALTELSLEGCPDLTSDFYQQLAEQAPNLVSLAAGPLNSSEIYTEGITSFCSLRRLKLVDCGETFNEDCVKAIAEGLKFLEEFDARGASTARFGDNCLLHISKSLASLKILRLHHVPTFTNAGFAHLTSLRHLEEMDIRHDHSRSNFTGDIGSTLQFSHSLRVLSLHCLRIDNVGLCSIMKSLSLRSLTLTDNAFLTSDGLKRAISSSNTPQNDGATSSSSSASTSTANSQGSLEELSLFFCRGVENLCFLEGLASLRRLQLHGINAGHRRTPNEGLKFPAMRKDKTGFNLLSTSSLLQELHLLHLEIEDTDIINELPQSVASSLKIVEFSHCDNLTNKVIFEGVARMSLLESVVVMPIMRRSTGSFDHTPPWKDIDDLLSNKLRNLKKFEVGDMLTHHVKYDPLLYRRFGHLINKNNDHLLRAGAGKVLPPKVADVSETASSSFPHRELQQRKSKTKDNNQTKTEVASAVVWGKGWQQGSATTENGGDQQQPVPAVGTGWGSSQGWNAVTNNDNDNNDDTGQKGEGTISLNQGWGNNNKTSSVSLSNNTHQNNNPWATTTTSNPAATTTTSASSAAAIALQQYEKDNKPKGLKKRKHL